MKEYIELVHASFYTGLRFADLSRDGYCKPGVTEKFRADSIINVYPTPGKYKTFIKTQERGWFKNAAFQTINRESPHFIIRLVDGSEHRVMTVPDELLPTEGRK